MHFESGGQRLHFEVSGAGLPLVLIHGGGLDGGAWEDLVPLLEEHFTTYRIDLRGYGQSRVTADAPPILASDWIADIVALLDSTGIARAGVVGWAMGGSIAARFAAQHPDRTRFIALLGTPGPETPVNVSGIREREALVASGLSPEEIVDRTFDYTKASISPAVLARSERSANRMRAGLIRNVDARYGELVNAFAQSIASIEVLERVRCPALVIVGEDDRRTPVAMGVELRRHLEHGHLKVLAECGHFYPYEQPQECARLLIEFSASHASRSKSDDE